MAGLKRLGESSSERRIRRNSRKNNQSDPGARYQLLNWQIVSRVKAPSRYLQHPSGLPIHASLLVAISITVLKMTLRTYIREFLMNIILHIISKRVNKKACSAYGGKSSIYQLPGISTSPVGRPFTRGFIHSSAFLE